MERKTMNCTAKVRHLFVLASVLLSGLFAAQAKTAYVNFESTPAAPSWMVLGTDNSDGVTGKPQVVNGQLKFPWAAGWLEFGSLCGQNFTVEFTIENFNYLCQSIGTDQMFGFQVIDSACFYPLAVWNVGGNKRIAIGDGCMPANAQAGLALPNPLPARATFRITVDNLDIDGSRTGTLSAYVAYNADATTAAKRASNWTKVGESTLGNTWNLPAANGSIRIYSNAAVADVLVDNIIAEANGVSEFGLPAPKSVDLTKTAYVNFSSVGGSYMPAWMAYGTDGDQSTLPQIANGRMSFPWAGGWMRLVTGCDFSYTAEFTIENFDVLCQNIGTDQMFGFQVIDSACMFPLAIWNVGGTKRVAVGDGCSPAYAQAGLALPNPLPARATFRIVVDNKDYDENYAGVTTAYVAYGEDATTAATRARRWTEVGNFAYGNYWNMPPNLSTLRIFSNAAVANVLIDNVFVESTRTGDFNLPAPRLATDEAFVTFNDPNNNPPLPQFLQRGTDDGGNLYTPVFNGNQVEFPGVAGWLKIEGIVGNDFSVEFTITNFNYLYQNLLDGHCFGLNVIDSAGFFPLALWNNGGQKKFYVASGFGQSTLGDSLAVPSPVPAAATLRMDVVRNDDYKGSQGTTILYVAFGSDAGTETQRGRNWRLVGYVPFDNYWNVSPGKVRIYNNSFVAPVTVDNLIVKGGNIREFGPTPPAMQAVQAPSVTIAQHNNMPAIFVENQPLPPLFHFSEKIWDEYAQQFNSAGFRFYSFIDEEGFLDLGWTGPYEFNPRRIDEVMNSTKHRLPNGYFIPRIHLWAPQWWLSMHPNEIQGYAVTPPAGSDSAHESLKSIKWREEAGEGLRQTIRHMMSQPYADRLIGVQLSTAAGGEWHPVYSDYYPDTSAPMLVEFRRYLREKYNDNLSALRTAWADQTVTFDTAAIPSKNERKIPNTGIFHNPASKCKTIDYYEAFNTSTAQAIDYFCRIVKEESGGKLLTVVNYAYQPDMGWVPNEMDHRAGAKGHRFSNIDIFSSPHEYFRRDLGENGNLRIFPESLALHGKLFIDECDERTHYAVPQLFRTSTSTEEDLQILRRGWGITFTHGAGMWYMDQSSGSWYDDPVLYAEFPKYQQWADWSMQLPRERRNDVAVITSNRSEFYIGSDTQLDGQLFVSQLDEMMKAGAPFNRYYLEDLVEGRVPAHKVYVFIDTFCLRENEITAMNNLKNNNRTLVWIYAPGFLTPTGFSLANMQSLTGLTFTQSSQAFDYINVNRTIFPSAPAQYRAWETDFGVLTTLNPRFVPNSSGMTTWGTYTNGSKGLVRKALSGWTTVYSPTSRIPWVVMNKIYQDAGVHLYCQNGDNLSANKSWISLHTTSAGTKTINLPVASPVYDVINNTLISSSTAQFQVTLGAQKTAIYMLADPAQF